MINSLVSWFGKRTNRGNDQHKTATFALSYITSDGSHHAGTGIDVSAIGLVFMTKESPVEKEFNVEFGVRNRNIRARVEVQRKSTTSQGGQRFHCINCKFTGIAADDWDTIVRFICDLPEPKNKLSGELTEVQKKADDAYRLLPLALQNKLVAMLVNSGRLEPPGEGQAPALRMEYLGANKRDDGSTVHRINVHSRRRVGDEWYAFDTQVTADESGNVQALN